MLAWVPGDVRCGDTTVSAQTMQQPLTALIWSGISTPLTLRYEFAIDAAGRTTDIRAASSGPTGPYSDDTAPSLAATRFVAGGASLPL